MTENLPSPSRWKSLLETAWKIAWLPLIGAGIILVIDLVVLILQGIWWWNAVGHAVPLALVCLGVFIVWRIVPIPVTAVFLALVAGAIILIANGNNPIEAYLALLRGSFGNDIALQRTLEKATPLVFSGLSVAFAFKAGLFNIGAQGQLLFGAITAAFIGFAVTGLPAVVHIPLALLAGAAAGGLYGIIPGVLKAYTGAHEVIVTIMLNYVAINLTDWLSDGPWKDNVGGNIVARTPQIEPTAVIPALGLIPVGFIISILIAVVIWWLLWRTTVGFEIRAVGLNPNAARYAGIKVARVVILTMVIAGLLAGIGGSVETLGVVGRYQPGFNTGLGFDGITVALLGRTHPIGVIPAALLVGAMKGGANLMQFDARVEKEIVDFILSLLLFFVAAVVRVRWLLRVRAKEGEEKITLTSGWGKQ